ncbi:acetyl-CoA hydrolase/transferase C-terminal domain-containing protein [Curvibacter sp. APW13]|uniref:acetyl-CoA hydrolase/transferase C-terminal domain-containing protein n=1 Tax=Curvibacter sp. APW13 TaxID=3077236 RepID=UPI0028DD85D6|nr:acetyl-CoA hydrolase/transferase C-terminal domain-containing protein [Curvibacter sp. APW13]MDT8992375.1 acetyl-CoA hydrolase/transferase C-terminal domain-containing protein [Curvibacter sp. APW13]
MTLYTESIEACVDHILDTVPGDIVLGIPLGVGKPNPLVNALYRRIRGNPSRRLRIVTALSLERPVGHSELEKNFLEPLVERVFEDYPDLDYVKDSRAGKLPANIEVREFFMKTGDYLGNETAQMHYISTNYTFVARDMVVQGMNVIAQAVASKEDTEGLRLSLSSNPDVSHEVVDILRASGKPIMAIGVINHKMPFMPNGAEVSPEFFDVVVTDPAGTHAVFAPPNGKVTVADYAIGLHASSLVVDGGTLQIGIGSLGDAIGQALIVRDRHNAEYRRILDDICVDGAADRDLGRFEQGLYGCSEMFVNAFLKLIEAGIVRREVYDDAVLQQLVNEGKAAGHAVTPELVKGLVDAGRLSSPLSAADVAFLKRFGILRAEVELRGEHLVAGDQRCSAQLLDDDALAYVCQNFLGSRLMGGFIMTGGFFLGPRDFYERLRSMPEHELAKIDMTRISFINQLYGDDALKRAQRTKARFINTTMIVTLLGAAASDALENGQVVSGVGGQYNFVAMSHALPDARLLMMLRATHDNKDGLKSSIVWNYGHVTIPRHLRDIVITEYGVADLRGQSDSEVVKRLIQVADSRFQAELIKQAKAHGKLEADYELPARYRNNTPQALADKLHPWMQAKLLPDFPFGTDLTEDEIHMVKAMKKMKHATHHPTELLSMVLKSLWEGKEAPPAYLERLGLAEARGFKEVFMRRLFANNL